jgi:hypothetical protein
VQAPREVVAAGCGLVGPSIPGPVESQFKGLIDVVGQVEQVADFSDGQSDQSSGWPAGRWVGVLW